MTHKIVYGQRYATLQSYDIDCINFLESINFTVVNLQASEVLAYDFSDVLLFIVGAPGTDNIGYPETTFLQNLEVNILSMCRNTSRYAFGMSLGSGVSTVDSFTVVDTTHEFTEGLSGTTLIGTAQTCHRMHNLTAETNLIFHIGLEGYAGVAEKFVTINTDTYTRLHWGYHEIASLNQAGSDLFEKVINSLALGDLMLGGSYISLPTDLSSFGVSAPDLKIKWIVENLSVDTTFTVESAIKGQSGGIPIEPLEEDWNLQENDTSILELPPDLTDQFLWVRVYIGRTAVSIPSPILSWLVVYNNTDSPLAAVRLNFQDQIVTIDETGSSLYSGVLQEHNHAYEVYVIPLSSIHEYDYLTSGSFYIDQASVEEVIIINAGDIPYESQDFPSEYETITVGTGTSVNDVIALLPETVTIYGLGGQQAEATINWSIPNYDPNIPGTYAGYGTVILPEGWTGEPSTIEISVIVSSPPSPPPAGTYDIWTKKNGKWVYATSIGAKKRSKWVGV